MGVGAGSSQTEPPNGGSQSVRAMLAGTVNRKRRRRNRIVVTTPAGLDPPASDCRVRTNRQVKLRLWPGGNRSGRAETGNCATTHQQGGLPKPRLPTSRFKLVPWRVRLSGKHSNTTGPTALRPGSRRATAKVCGGPENDGAFGPGPRCSHKVHSVVWR